MKRFTVTTALILLVVLLCFVTTSNASSSRDFTPHPAVFELEEPKAELDLYLVVEIRTYLVLVKTKDVCGRVFHHLDKPFQIYAVEHFYYGYRWYDASNGRWINRDPIKEDGGMNIYNFCDGDPINHWDYLGMQTLPSPEWHHEVCQSKLNPMNKLARQAGYSTNWIHSPQNGTIMDKGPHRTIAGDGLHTKGINRDRITWDKAQAEAAKKWVKDNPGKRPTRADINKMINDLKRDPRYCKQFESGTKADISHKDWKKVKDKAKYFEELKKRNTPTTKPQTPTVQPKDSALKQLRRLPSGTGGTGRMPHRPIAMPGVPFGGCGPWVQIQTSPELEEMKKRIKESQDSYNKELKSRGFLPNWFNPRPSGRKLQEMRIHEHRNNMLPPGGGIRS